MMHFTSSNGTVAAADRPTVAARAILSSLRSPLDRPHILEGPPQLLLDGTYDGTTGKTRPWATHASLRADTAGVPG